MLTMMAVERGNNRMGTTNVKAKMNFDRKVQTVDSQISFVLCLFSDSSET
jgi:hypothetical protein